MAKKVSDLTPTIAQVGDAVEIYRPSAPTSDLRTPLPLPTYQPVTALEAEAGYVITRTSADILVELIEEPAEVATYALPTGVVGDRVRLRRSVVGGFDWTRTGGGDAEDVLRALDNEIEYQCITAPSTWARLIRRHGAAVTTLPETSGAVDLVLVPDQRNHFINNVSLTAELVWNLPSANAWIGAEVIAVRTGGGEFDLVLVGSPLRLRKGQVGVVVSDGVSWNPVEDRLDWLQVRETSSTITLSYQTHSGKIVRATANTNTVVKLKDTSSTQSTFRVMSHAGPARTMTFQPADTTDGDGTMINGTLGGSVVFSIPLNTPMMFLAYAELNASGSLAQYIVMAFGAGTGSGSGAATEAAVLGTFNPATAIAITNWEGVYTAYSQGGTVSPSLNVAGSTINGGTVIIPWTNNNHTINWNANLVDFKTKLNADIRTSWTGLRMVLIRFDEVAGRGEVIFADVDATEVIATPGGGLAGATVQAQLTELDSEKAPLANPVFTGIMKLAGAKGTAAVKTAAYSVVAADSGQLHVCTTTGFTITLPAVSTLAPNSGDFFALDVHNDTGGNVVLDGPGATNVTMANGELATVYARNGGKLIVAKGAATVLS